MPPNAVEVENTMDMSGIINGAISAGGLGRGDDILVHVTTFNCANFPHPRLPIAFPPSAPDLLVLGLQELAPSQTAFLNLSVIENVYLQGLGTVTEIAKKKYGRDYKLVKIVRVGQTALVVWSSLGHRLRKVQTAWAGCGLFGLLANKGAAATRLSFVNGSSIVCVD